MTCRAYCDDLPRPPRPARVVLDGAEARHLTSVLRLGPGDAVELFDGRGGWARAEISKSGRREVELSIHEFEQDRPVGGLEVVVATAFPKGDRARSMVEKLTELGVDRLVPLKTRHSVVHPRDGKLNKMQQAVVAACKQCGRNRLMQIDGLTEWGDLLAVKNQSLIVAQRGGGSVSETISGVLHQSAGSLVLCVGPEGGWSADELRAAVSAGAHEVGLGGHVLRIETAAVALAAAVATSDGLFSE